MKVIRQRVVSAAVIVILAALVGWIVREYTTLEWLIARETQLRELVSSSPLAAWIIGFLIYTALSVIPGTSGKAVIAGWLYGFWPALLMVDAALTVAALITFSLSRRLFRESVEARFGVHVMQFRKKLGADTGFSLLMLRLLHTPFSLMNAVSGATGVVSVKTFWWTTQLGLIPGTAVFVLAGTRIPSLSAMSESGPMALLDKDLILALAAMLLLPLLLRTGGCLVRRFRGWYYGA